MFQLAVTTVEAVMKNQLTSAALAFHSSRLLSAILLFILRMNVANNLKPIDRVTGESRELRDFVYYTRRVHFVAAILLKHT